MSDTVTPGLQDVYAAIATFIVGVTGLAADQVVQGLPNRAPMPLPGFVMFQATEFRRLRTNQHGWDEIDPQPATMAIDQAIELTVQIDCYGPSSADWATMLSTLLRDEYGCTALAPSCQPLFADEARMIPLVDGEEQYEERWSLDARFQVNPVTTIPQQYADTLDLNFVSVEERFPP